MHNRFCLYGRVSEKRLCKRGGYSKREKIKYTTVTHATRKTQLRRLELAQCHIVVQRNATEGCATVVLVHDDGNVGESMCGSLWKVPMLICSDNVFYLSDAPADTRRNHYVCTCVRGSGPTHVPEDRNKNKDG
jgi:hypothetical protein